MRGMIHDSFIELVHRKIIWAFGVVVLLSFLAIVATTDIEAKFNITSGPGADMQELNEAFGNPILKGFDMGLSILLFMAVMSVAGLLPGMFEKGRAEFYLSKPLGRSGLLSRRMFAIWLVYGSTVVVSSLILYVGVGLFHGVWSSAIIVLILLSLGSFLVWLSIVFFVGVLSQSTAIGMMAVFLTWVLEKIIGQRELYKSLLDSPTANNVIDTIYYIIPKPDEVSGIFFKIAAGEEVLTWTPLWTTALISILFLYLATFVFRRRDF